MYEGRKEDVKKSWALRLQKSRDGIMLVACDILTGTWIANVLSFTDGEIINLPDIYNILNYEGYDPYEYNNRYLSDGQLLIVEYTEK